MKQNSFFCLSLFLCLSNVLCGQEFFTPSQMVAANTVDSVTYMSDEEKKVVLYMNLARLDGAKFYEAYIPQFLEYYNNTFGDKILPNNKYLLSLKADLKKIKGYGLLRPNKNLWISATFHAKDMGQTGKTGHNSSDGTDCNRRIRRFNPNIGCWAENCSYGMDSALNIVCQLLIDNNISTLGHRTNILKLIQKMVGVGIATHKVFRTNCVMDFGCD